MNDIDNRVWVLQYEESYDYEGGQSIIHGVFLTKELGIQAFNKLSDEVKSRVRYTKDKLKWQYHISDFGDTSWTVSYTMTHESISLFGVQPDEFHEGGIW